MHLSGTQSLKIEVIVKKGFERGQWVCLAEQGVSQMTAMDNKSLVTISWELLVMEYRKYFKSTLDLLKYVYFAWPRAVVIRDKVSSPVFLSLTSDVFFCFFPSGLGLMWLSATTYGLSFKLMWRISTGVHSECTEPQLLTAAQQQHCCVHTVLYHSSSLLIEDFRNVPGWTALNSQLI